MTKVITKVYSCKQCGITMFLESFTDEQTTLEMIKQNPYCDECEKSEEIIRDDNSINAKALFEQLVAYSTIPQAELEADIRSKAKELSTLRAEIRGTKAK